MNNLSDLVSNLCKKAEKLAAKHKILLQNNVQLVSENKQLKQDLNQKNKQLTALEDNVKILKIAGNVKNNSTKDVKLKINEMVREIDKCIAQISR